MPNICEILLNILRRLKEDTILNLIRVLHHIRLKDKNIWQCSFCVIAYIYFLFRTLTFRPAGQITAPLGELEVNKLINKVFVLTENCSILFCFYGCVIHSLCPVGKWIYQELKWMLSHTGAVTCNNYEQFTGFSFILKPFCRLSEIKWDLGTGNAEYTANQPRAHSCFVKYRWLGRGINVWPFHLPWNS